MSDLFEILLRSFAMMAVIIAVTRANGLRSFSKMSGFDFAVTVAVGSVLAGAVTAPDKSLWIGIGGILGLYAFQGLMGRVRARVDAVQDAIDNAPLLVMRDGEILDDNLLVAQMSRADLLAKLREANALSLDDVAAVIVEGTGDVSVLHGGRVDARLLEGVRGAD